jgi:hypothetical protein
MPSNVGVFSSLKCCGQTACQALRWDEALPGPSRCTGLRGVRIKALSGA